MNELEINKIYRVSLLRDKETYDIVRVVSKEINYKAQHYNVYHVGRDRRKTSKLVYNNDIKGWFVHSLTVVVVEEERECP